MSLVTLVSGGLDSTLMAIFAKEEGIKQYPLFIDYGQICKKQELRSCLSVHKKYGLPDPEIMDLNGYGKLISSGITDSKYHIHNEAFLPGRNLLFLLAACSYAYQKNSSAVAIGLLNEENAIFPDQTKNFVTNSERLIKKTIGRDIKVLTPLMTFTKKDVIEMAKKKNLVGTYSCHAGLKQPCGVCVSCIEFINATE